MKKSILIAAVSVIMFLIMALPSSAAAEIDSGQLKNIVPDSLKRFLPDDAYSEEGADDLLDTLDASFFLDFGAQTLTGALKSALGSFAVICGMIIIASVMQAAKGSFASGAAADVFEWVSVIAVAAAAYSVIFSQFKLVTDTLSDMSVFLGGLLPVMTAIYIAGGSITTASVNSAGMTLLIGVIDAACTKVLLPVLRICFGLDITSYLSNQADLSSITNFVRKAFIFITGLVMAILTTVFAFQTSIARSADSIGLRSAKFAAGSLIPVIGGSVSDAVSTLLGSLSLIKSVTGAIGIAVILLICLPTIITLAATKLSISLSGAVAGTLGCGKISKMLSDAAKLMDFTIASVIIFDIMAIFNLTIFLNTVYGGG